MAATVEEPSCGNCKYWGGPTEESENLSECRRYPPVLINFLKIPLDNDLSLYELCNNSYCSVTEIDEICGEWKRCKKR